MERVDEKDLTLQQQQQPLAPPPPKTVQTQVQQPKALRFVTNSGAPLPKRSVLKQETYNNLAFLHPFAEDVLVQHVKHVVGARQHVVESDHLARPVNRTRSNVLVTLRSQEQLPRTSEHIRKRTPMPPLDQDPPEYQVIHAGNLSIRLDQTRCDLGSPENLRKMLPEVLRQLSRLIVSRSL